MSVLRPLVWLLVMLAACRDRQVSEPRRVLPIETAIARDLTARFGTLVTTRCLTLTVVPLKCTATLSDGTELPIAIEHTKADWGWRVDGIVIEARAIAAFVEAGLAGVGVEQAVDCGPPIQVIEPGERVVCKLAGGGAGFVEIAGDGTASLELALDAASAAARMELSSADRDRDLIKQSKDLERLAGESDGEEAVFTADAGVP